MPYVERIVEAGPIAEHRKMFSSRVHTKGAERATPSGKTPKAQEKVNERKAEERLRWTINANYKPFDLHAVLHYFDKEITLEQEEADTEAFLRVVRREYRKRGIPWKCIKVVETKRMTNVHIHLILKKIDPEVLARAWEKVAAGGGGISFRPLDRRGDHRKLANYLMKESRSTAARYKEMGRRCKRYSCSKGMDQPVITYRVVPAKTWRADPRPRKGYILQKYDDGATTRSGWHEVSGWPWQEYVEIRAEERPPGKYKTGGRKNE